MPNIDFFYVDAVGGGKFITEYGAAHACASEKERGDMDTRSCPLPGRSYRLISTMVLQGHPGSSGALLRLSSLLTPESVVTPYLVQATSVYLHTHIQRRDLPAAGIPSHMYLLPGN